MSAAPYPITTSLRVIKALQYVKETTKGITPTSPVFTEVPVSEFEPTTAVKSIRYIKVGTSRVSKTIRNTTNYNVSVVYSPTTVDQLFESMINLTGTNSREDTYTFLISQEHNNAGTLEEMYQIARGCTIGSLSISVSERNLITINSRWLASSISDWSTSHGLTTPVFADELTTTPWSAIDTGLNPLVFTDLDDGELYDIRNLSITINHNTTRTQILDQLHTVRIDPGILNVTIMMDVVFKDPQISESVSTFAAQEIKMRINLDPSTQVATTLTLSEVFLEQYDERVDAEDRQAKVVSYFGPAAAIDITQEDLSIIVTATSIHKYNIGGAGNFDDDNFIGANFTIDT